MPVSDYDIKKKSQIGYYYNDIPIIHTDNQIIEFNEISITHINNVNEIMDTYYTDVYHIEQHHRDIITKCLVNMDLSLMVRFDDCKHYEKNTLLDLIDWMYSEVLSIEFDFVYEQNLNYDEMDMRFMELMGNFTF